MVLGLVTIREAGSIIRTCAWRIAKSGAFVKFHGDMIAHRTAVEPTLEDIEEVFGRNNWCSLRLGVHILRFGS